MKKQAQLAFVHRLIIYVWVFALVLALFPLNANPVKHIKELVSSIAVLLLAVTMLAQPVRPGEPYDWRRMPALFLAGAWLLWGLLCALFSEFKMAGVDELRIYITWFLIALFAARVFREPRHVNSLFLAVCGAVFLSSVYGFMQYMGLDIFPWSTRNIEEYRGLPSTYANPNFAGHTLMLTLVVGGSLVMTRSFRWVVVLLVPVAAHLYLTHMRGAPLALAAGCVLLFCAIVVSRYLRVNKELKTAAALGGTAVIGIIAILALLPVSKMLTGFYVPTDGSLILRYNGYYGAAKMVADNPVLGVGPGNYGREAIAHWTPYEKRWFADQQKRNMRTHCDLLETATESGLPGLALHVPLLMALLVRSLSLAFAGGDPDRRRIGYALAVFFMAFTVDGLFGFNLRVPVSGGLFFLMAGVLEGISAPVIFSEPAAQPDKKKKKRIIPVEPPPDPETQPRVLSSLMLCGAALFCLVVSAVVLVGEMYYQRGTAARLFIEENPSSPHLGQALKQGEENLLIGRRLVFWDERYSDLLGHIAMLGGKTEEAVGYYTRALASDPHHPHKAANLARAYLSHALRFARDNTSPDYVQVGHLLDEARRLAEQAEVYCGISPYVQDVRWRVTRAEAVLAEEQQQDAIPYWQKVSQQIQEALACGATDIAGTYRALGSAYVKLNQPGRAMEAFSRALELKTEDEMTWSMMETAAHESGNTGTLLNLSYKNYALLAENLPETENAFIATVRRLAHGWKGLNRASSAAARVVSHGLGKAPGPPETWALLAEIAADRKDPAILCGEARRHASSGKVPVFVKGLCPEQGESPQIGESSRELARLAIQSQGQPAAKDFGAAADLLNLLMSGMTLPPSHEAGIRANLATAYLEAERYAEADRDFAFAIDNLPQKDRGRLLSARARAVEGLGRSEEAMSLVSEAVRLAPNDPIVQLTYARLLRGGERFDEAVFAYTAAINSLPDKTPLKAQAQRELESMRVRQNLSATKLEL